MSVVLIFPKISFRDVVTLVFIYLYQLAFIADGLLYLWIDTRFLLLPTRTLGPFVGSVHLIPATGVAECTLLRSYCLYKMIRFGKSSIVWHTVSIKIKQSDHPKLFKVTQFLFFQIVVGGTAIIIADHMTKLLE